MDGVVQEVNVRVLGKGLELGVLSRDPGTPCHFDRYFFKIPGNNIPLFMHYI